MRIINFLNLTVFMVFGCLLSIDVELSSSDSKDSIDFESSITSFNFSSFQEIEEEEEEDLELTFNPEYLELTISPQIKLITPKHIEPEIFRYNTIWKPPQIS